MENNIISNWLEKHGTKEIDDSVKAQIKSDIIKEFTERLECMDLEQVVFTDELISTLSKFMLSKGDLVKLTYDKSANIDTALPHEFVQHIQTIHPNFNTMFHVYDYSKGFGGQLQNLAEILILKCKEVYNK